MTELLALADDEAAALWEGLRLGYTEPAGHPLLRAEIASLYEGLEPDDVYTFAGAEEAIFVLMHALLRPGDHVLALWPAYQGLYEIARSIGADVTLLELHEAQDWQIDLDRFRDALRPGSTRLVVANWPHSPTGTLPQRATFEDAALLAREAGASFFVDEVYRFLEHEPGMRLPAAAEIGSWGVSLGVMSKAFGLAGLRIGWLASTDEDLLARCARVKDYTTICSAAPSEILALIGLSAKEILLDRALELVMASRDRVEDFLAEHPQLSWVRPQAGSVGYMRLPSSVSAAALCDDLVLAESVLLLPSTVFGHGDGHVRIGLGRRDTGESLARFARFLRRPH